MAVVERYEMSTLAVLLCFVNLVQCGQIDIELDAKAALLHKIDSLNILLYTFLLTLTVVTIWLFKHRRLRFLHETGLAVIYGLILGGLIRYLGRESSVTKMTVDQDESDKYNGSFPPDVLFLRFTSQGASSHLVNKTYSYNFRGVNTDVANDIDLKATFDPEVFFNIILPPIIFHAGYSLKRKYFFRNFGSILTYAVLGTTISAFIIGALLYGVILAMSGKSSMTFLDTLFFGALISPTDPVTILAIFSDLKVDATLYSLVFGESVLNDAVAIVLSGSIQNYAEHYQSGSGGFETKAFFLAFGDFVEIFSLSFLIGAAMGCITALLTKFTHLRDFPLLESALFVLMSYSTFLIAESAGLTGVVSVLFCGICQAHYTYNNLSKDSRKRTKQLFELLNFLAENFIFSYIGVSMFTFPKHKFDVGFIIAGFVCACVGRAANIYPLSFIINLGRKPKIPGNFQHMLFYSGLRGAMSFALAIRNTVTEARQMMLTTTSLIVIATVVIQGGATMQLLSFFKIPVGVEEEVEMLPYAGGRGNCRTVSPELLPLLGDSDQAVSPELSKTATIRYHDGTLARLRPNYSTAGTPTAQDGEGRGDKAWAAKVWADFDSKYMKPLLTQSRPTLLETLPVCCVPLARLLTTTQQMTQDNYRCESDSDLCIDESISRESSSHRIGMARQNGEGEMMYQQHISLPGAPLGKPL